MPNITILGQGAMGSRMANRLEAAGHSVTRWNRTRATLTPREAVAAADLVIAMVRDDEASRDVWTGNAGALGGMRDGAVAVESSTLTVDWVCELGSEARRCGINFLDAPVLGSRPQAEAGHLIHLIGGDVALIERIRPVLAVLGTMQLHTGPVGTGAALKLIANTLFGIQVAAAAELIARMPSLGLDPTVAIDLLGQTPVISPAAKNATGLILADRHAPMFPVELVAKDLGYAIGQHGVNMPVAAAAQIVFVAALLKGLGGQNLTAVSHLYDEVSIDLQPA